MNLSKADADFDRKLKVWDFARDTRYVYCVQISAFPFPSLETEYTTPVRLPDPISTLILLQFSDGHFLTSFQSPLTDPAS